MVKKPVNILFDVFVKVEKFIVPANFVVMSCEVDLEMYIIFVRSLLSNGRTLVDMERGELKFRLTNEELMYNVCRTIKHRKDMRVVSIINFLDDPGSQPKVILIKSE